MTPQRVRRISGLVVALAAVTACPATGQTGDIVPREDGTKTYLFRSLLKFAGVEPLESLPRGDTSGVVLVLFGRIDTSTVNWSRRVLADGGAVLIATDSSLHLGQFTMPSSGLLLGAGPVEAVAPTPETCFQNDPAMPFLNTPDVSFENPDLARMVSLRQVATNTPNALSPDRGQLTGFLNTPLAMFPANCRFTDGRRLPSRAVAVTNDPVRNRTGAVAAVYADKSIFTNQMLLARGTDNFAYAYFLARYLATGPTGDRKRTRCLFVEDGEVKTDFDTIPLITPESHLPPSPPVPPIEQLQDKITDAANAALDDLQTRDVMGRAVANQFNRIAPVLAAVVAAFVTLVLLRRVWAARHHPEFTTPPPSGAADGTPLDRRRQDVLRSNDVYEPLREHLRGLFARWGGPDGGPDLPPVETSTTAADRRVLLAKLRRLWEIAHGETPVAVPFVRWKELEPMIESVTHAAEAGRWRFARPGGAA
jgi:hypothetical protein